MTYAELKREIIFRIATKMVTSDLQPVQLAATETDLIDAIKPILLFLVKNNILDAWLLAEFVQANLNAAGIYSNGTHALVNPDYCMILLDADVTINNNGDNIAEVHHFGTSLLTVTCEDNSFMQLSLYGSSTSDITATDNSILVDLLNDESDQTLQLSLESVAEMHLNHQSNLDVTLNNDSIGVLRTFNESTAGYLKNDSSYLNINKSDGSIVIDNSIIP